MVKRQITVLKFFSRDLFSLKTVIILAVISIVYLFFSTALLNIKLITSIFANPLELFDKFRITGAIVIDALGQETAGMRTLMIMISALFALNIMLVTKRLKFVTKRKNLNLTFGAGLLTIASSGCPACCGFSLVSLLGLGGAMTILPFDGKEFMFVAVGLLIFSVFYNLNSTYKSCVVTS